MANKTKKAIDAISKATSYFKNNSAIGKNANTLPTSRLVKKAVPIATKDGKPQVKEIKNGLATVFDGRKNYYTLDLNKLSFVGNKNKAPNITQVGDGIATIKDGHGNLHNVKMSSVKYTNKKVNEDSKSVPLKKVNDDFLPIPNKDGTPSVSVTKGVATVHNGRQNYYTLDLNKLSFIKDKSKKPNITQVNDGIATIKDDNGNLHDVRMTLKK